jgi:hypothetical protein
MACLLSYAESKPKVIIMIIVHECGVEAAGGTSRWRRSGLISLKYSICV